MQKNRKRKSWKPRKRNSNKLGSAVVHRLLTLDSTVHHSFRTVPHGIRTVHNHRIRATVQRRNITAHLFLVAVPLHHRTPYVILLFFSFLYAYKRVCYPFCMNQFWNISSCTTLNYQSSSPAARASWSTNENLYSQSVFAQTGRDFERAAQIFNSSSACSTVRIKFLYYSIPIDNFVIFFLNSSQKLRHKWNTSITIPECTKNKRNNQVFLWRPKFDS